MSLSVDTMRTIDHRVGVPLCALATPIVWVLDWITRLFGGTCTSPRKVLFIELSEMGSAIIVDPAMRATQARGAEIFFLIFKSNRASLSLLNTVPPENVFTIDSSSVMRLALDTLKFLLWSRARKIERFLSQPFHVAEIFTGKPGKFVSLPDSIAGFKALLSGAYDDLPESAFYMVGDIAEVQAKAAAIAAESKD